MLIEKKDINRTCIYCSQSNNFNKEHCIPIGLGTFKNAHILQESICKACNNKISKSEAQFLGSGPEAFFRQLLGIKGRKEHIKKSPFYYGKSGSSPIRMLCKHPTEGIEVLCEIVNSTNTAAPIEQIIFKDDIGNIKYTIIRPDIDTSEKLTDLVKREIDTIKYYPIYYYIDFDKEGMFLNMLKTLYPNKKKNKSISLDKIEKTQVEIKYRVTGHYFQAVAKIAFHYFLSVFSSQFRGDESCFSPIRSFILNGNADTSKFVHYSNKQFVYDFTKGYTTKNWGHLLVAEKNEKFINVKIQFFVGPTHMPPVHEVLIGKNPRRFVYPEKYGHFYFYYQNKQKEAFQGEIEEILSGRIF